MTKIASKGALLLHVSPSLLKPVFISYLSSLVPSFLRPIDSTAKQTKLHPTAYLDGLRGVAAFFVFIHHFILDWYPYLSNGYASSPQDVRIAQLPFVRIIYSGKGMVTTFFIISGYVLSYKALSLSHSGRYSTLFDSLSSSVFRRGMRLFIPTTVSTFMSLILSRLNFFRQDPRHVNQIPTRQPSILAELGVWLKYTVAIADPFQIIGGTSKLFGHPYDGHLWTIPVEYRGSLIVFVTILCLAKVRPNIRLSVLASLVAYTLYQAHWEACLFLCGCLYADIGFLRVARTDRLPNTPTDVIDYLTSPFSQLSKRSKSILGEIFITFAFILGLHLLCYPDFNADKSPGYIYLTKYLTPPPYHAINKAQKFFITLGAMLLVASVGQSSILQRPFTTSFSQYLGKISYALYMVHGPILYTGGMIILLAAKKNVDEAREASQENPEVMAAAQVAYSRDFGKAVVFNTVISFWAADWMWRVVDTRAVMLARKVGEWCWVEE